LCLCIILLKYFFKTSTGEFSARPTTSRSDLYCDRVRSGSDYTYLYYTCYVYINLHSSPIVGPAKIYAPVASDVETGRKGPGKIPRSGSSCQPPPPTTDTQPLSLIALTWRRKRVHFPFNDLVGLIARCPYPKSIPESRKALVTACCTT